MQENVSTSDTESEDSAPHYYHCPCSECQVKYGSLPLLIQVIEDQENLQKTKVQGDKPTSGDTSIASTSSINPSQLVADTQDMPSTSRSFLKKEISCPHCDKTFSHRGDLNKHLRKHTGEQPYSCPTCNRKFAHTSNLTRHLRIHSGVRPFQCDVCKKRFNRKDKLDMHRKTKLCKKLKEKKQ